MKVFRFFLARVFLRKPILVAVLLALIFATNYIAFTATRTLVSTTEGASEVARFNVPGTFIGNLDPESVVDFDKISDAAISDVYHRVENDFSFALFTDGYIAQIPNERDVEVPVAYMNQKYSELNGFRIAARKGLDFQYELNKSNSIPVIVGTGLADQYPMGSELSLVDPGLNKEVRYRVTGILERDSSHSNLYALDSKQYYNFSVIVPVTDSFIEQAQTSFKINGLMDLTLTDTTRPKAQELGRYIEDKIALKLNFFSQQENIDFYNQYFGSSMAFLSVISTVLLVAIMLLAVWSSLAGVRVMVREFTINLLVGLSYRRFRRLLLGYYGLLSSVALLAVFVMVVFSRYATWERKDASFMTYGIAGGLMEMDWIALAAAALANLILVFIVSQCVVWKIWRVPISVGVLQ